MEPAGSYIPKSKHELAAKLIKKILANGPVESMEIKKLMAEYRIGDKTMNEVKAELGIKPYRKMRSWYWVLPGEENKEVSGFSAEDYQTACESVEAPADDEKVTGRRLNMGGYQLVRPEFFPSIERPSMTISNGKLRFNTACLKKFEDVEYVELLLNTVTSTIAIRPCEKDNPNAIHWGRLREKRWVVSTMGCKGLSRTLFDLMSWEDEGKYTFSGQFKVQGENKLLLFELGEPVITKTVEQIVVPEEAEEEGQDGQEEIVIREQVRVYPASWASSFGEPVNVLVHHHFSGDWDVLRPATELAKMNIITADQLDQLMKEAETIMEGWAKTA